MLEDLKQKLQQGQTLRLKIKVTPKSGHHEIGKIMADGTIKIKLKSAPENNKANEELIKLLSQYFQVSSKCITIKTGQTAALKIIKIQPKINPNY